MAGGSALPPGVSSHCPLISVVIPIAWTAPETPPAETATAVIFCTSVQDLDGGWPRNCDLIRIETEVRSMKRSSGGALALLSVLFPLVACSRAKVAIVETNRVLVHA